MNKAYNNSHQAVYGINKFADLTQEEFKAQYLTGLKRNGCMRKQHFASAVTPKDLKSLGIPQKFDWREKGVLTGIRNQESCGACWSFSVVETMESMYAITYKSNFSTPELSVQQLIDCDYDNSGCKGGDICKAAVWAHLNGVVNESLYPLTDQSDNCKTPPVSVPRIYVADYACDSFQGQEIEMLKLLAQHGPIAVAVDATTWHNYIGGIIQFHCSSNINHAVQIVGYDLTGDVPYYIIRNSWGADFGDHGFIYIKYGENLCGLTVEVSHLNVTDYQ
uniref:Peptidase C1A papain C-terminal domain-containing protein n=2 Tax=Arion vulgaris TaxID=1028688 RepID=A0A0B7ATW9_9EUPU